MELGPHPCFELRELRLAMLAGIGGGSKASFRGVYKHHRTLAIQHIKSIVPWKTTHELQTAPYLVLDASEDQCHRKGDFNGQRLPTSYLL